jgi:hypothetical protein
LDDDKKGRLDIVDDVPLDDSMLAKKGPGPGHKEI